jgi:predicted permease
MLEAESSRGFVLTDRGDAGQHAGGVTSAGFFDLYGVAPRLGRTFQATDDTPGAEAVVVVSDAFWRTQLGADPGVVGTSIRLNDEPHTVIGVMPPLFQPGGAALWVTLRMSDTQRAVRNSNFLRLVGRLSPGTDAAQAGAELDAKWRPIREAFPRGNEDTGLTATPLRELIAQRSRTPLLILAGAAGFVLLIACANVANLMLVRAERRQREVGVRAALGARRGRLARQFLTEGLLISLLGGAIGVVVAYGGVRWLLGTFASAVPRAQEIGISLPVLGFTLLASMVTGVLVGLAPALRSRPDFEILREGSRGGTARFTRIGKSLVVAEVALALMLVTGAGLLLKSYARAVDSDLGFDARGLAAVSLWFPQSRYTDNSQRQIFMDQLVSDLTANPAIEAVALANMVPIREFGNNWTEVAVAGRDDAKAAFVEARNVSPSYFATMGIPLLSGRLFTEEEARADGGSNVVVINRTLARQLFGDSAALGWQLAIAQQPPEIIGVVEDVRDLAPDQPSRPMIYFGGVQGGNLMVRSAGGSATAVDAVRNAVLQIDAEVAVIRFDTMEQVLDQALSGRRFQLTLIGVFALTALILACVGIYGVLSYSVERQTREIGVRMALGAHAGRVAALVAWRGGRLALIGVVLGLGGALALRRAIAAQLFEVGTFDPMVYLGVSGLLLAVAGLASFLPARRAALVLPTQALRTE